MKIFKKHWLLIGILVFSLLARGYNYEKFPIAGETADETAWTYLGASLLQTGRPASWSFFQSYEDKIIYQPPTVGDEVKAPIVSPVLDHPPLFSFLPGFFHSLKNEWMNEPSIKLIRFPMIFLGTLNVFLLYLVAKTYFSDHKIVWLSTLMYATAPAFVFASRLVVAENLLITWMLLALWLIGKKDQRWRYQGLAFLGALSILTKVSGIVLPVSIFAVGLVSQDRKMQRAGILGLLTGVGAFLCYSVFYDWSLFLQVQLAQAGRNLGLATLQNRWFLHPYLIEKVFLDGWVMMGLVTSFYFVFQKSHSTQKNYLNIFFVVNVFFLALTVGETTFHGWYNYILFPLFALNIGRVLRQAWKQRNMWLFALFWLFFLPGLRQTLVHLHIYESLGNFGVRFFILMGLLPLALEILFSKKFLTHAMIIFLGLVVISANLVTVFGITDRAYWESDEYFLPSRTVK